MKRLLVVFLVLVSGFSYLVGFNRAQQAVVRGALNATASIGRPFWIPDSSLFSAPSSWRMIYPILQDAAKTAGVNVFRTDFGYTQADKPEINIYAFLT